MSKLKTPRDGASEERSKILRKVRSVRKLIALNKVYAEEVIDIIEGFIQARVRRFNKKPKGL